MSVRCGESAAMVQPAIRQVSRRLTSSFTHVGAKDLAFNAVLPGELYFAFYFRDDDEVTYLGHNIAVTPMFAMSMIRCLLTVVHHHRAYHADADVLGTG